MRLLLVDICDLSRCLLEYKRLLSIKLSLRLLSMNVSFVQTSPSYKRLLLLCKGSPDGGLEHYIFWLLHNKELGSLHYPHGLFIVHCTVHACSLAQKGVELGTVSLTFANTEGCSP